MYFWQQFINTSLVKNHGTYQLDPDIKKLAKKLKRKKQIMKKGSSVVFK